MVLSVLGGVAYPKCQREGVHTRCRTTSPTAWALVVHPELGKMHGPQVSACWCFEGIGGERWWSKAPVHIMNTCVLLMSMPLENRMQHRGGFWEWGKEEQREVKKGCSWKACKRASRLDRVHPEDWRVLVATISEVCTETERGWSGWVFSWSAGITSYKHA